MGRYSNVADQALWQVGFMRRLSGGCALPHAFDIPAGTNPSGAMRRQSPRPAQRLTPRGGPSRSPPERGPRAADTATRAARMRAAKRIVRPRPAELVRHSAGYAETAIQLHRRAALAAARAGGCGVSYRQPTEPKFDQSGLPSRQSPAHHAESGYDRYFRRLRCCARR